MARAVVVSFLLISCSERSEDPAIAEARQDAAALHEALDLARSDLDAASARCAELHAPERRDLCLVALLQVQRRPEQAGLLCGKVQDRIWAEECRFQVIQMELAFLDPLQATRRCYEELPRFGRHCMGHAETAWAEPTARRWFHADHLDAQLEALASAVPGRDRARIDLLRPRALASAAPPGSPLQGEPWWLPPSP